MRLARGGFLAALAATGACSTAGSTWMSEPMTAEDGEDWKAGAISAPPAGAPAGGDPERFRTRVIGGEEPPAAAPAAQRAPRAKGAAGGRSLGTFRNTYYDFPAESEFAGEPVTVNDARCKPIAEVARGFYEALCVQGSGLLRSGRPVSFAKRDCECAEVCPRTGQKICFEALDPLKFPWGRGALGTAITPLLTVAVDDTVVPMGTPIYVPEFDGLPLDPARSAVHDGCFIAQDRGMKVKGQHIDVFTGHEHTTKLWNRLVPSNQGVTVVVESPRCARAPAP